MTESPVSSPRQARLGQAPPGQTTPPGSAPSLGGLGASAAAPLVLRARRAADGWTILHWLALIAVLLPFLALAAGLLGPPGRYWGHVRDHLLRDCLAETAYLTVGSCLAAWILGVATAWLVSLHDFPARRLLGAALVLPLAIPPYLGAYAYDGLLSYTGLVQTVARNHLDLNLAVLGYWPPAGARAILVFSLTLFPYVYLMTRAFLSNQGAALMENARLLGGGRLRMFRKVGLPLILPASGAGAMLVALEVLNDFGVASHYGLSTFSTAIFTAWFGLADPDAAIKLAMILLVLVFAVLVLRALATNLEKYHVASSRERPHSPKMIPGPAKWAATFACAAAALGCFAIPVLQLLLWLRLTWSGAFNAALLRACGYTLLTAVSGVLIVMVFAIGSVNAGRLHKGSVLKITGQAASLGYAIPSAVLAIGVIVVFVAVDKLLIALIPSMTRMALSMSSFMLVFAFSVRFLTIGRQSVEAGYAKMGGVYAEASRLLGRGSTATFLLVELPLIKPAVIAGAALVFVDIAKELPLSLILRPFNTETLGTWAYHFAKNEVLPETAAPSLMIIAAGAVFILLARLWDRSG